MARYTYSYTHGDTGSEPDTALDFQKNDRPNAQNFDWLWYTVTEAISGHAEEFDRLDSDDDGVVDAADGAATWSNNGNLKATHPTDIDFTGNINVSSDGDGTATVNVPEVTHVESANTAEHATGFKTATSYPSNPEAGEVIFRTDKT